MARGIKYCLCLFVPEKETIGLFILFDLRLYLDSALSTEISFWHGCCSSIKIRSSLLLVASSRLELSLSNVSLETPKLVNSFSVPFLYFRVKVVRKTTPNRGCVFKEESYFGTIHSDTNLSRQPCFPTLAHEKKSLICFSRDLAFISKWRPLNNLYNNRS